MSVVIYCQPGLTPYVRFDDDDHTTLPMTAGATGDGDRYELLDADIETAGLAEGIYNAVIRNGDDTAPDEADSNLGFVTNFIWDGTQEIKTNSITSISINQS